jgi:hypothetical protein
MGCHNPELLPVLTVETKDGDILAMSSRDKSPANTPVEETTEVKSLEVARKNLELTRRNFLLGVAGAGLVSMGLFREFYKDRGERQEKTEAEQKNIEKLARRFWSNVSDPVAASAIASEIIDLLEGKDPLMLVWVNNRWAALSKDTNIRNFEISAQQYAEYLCRNVDWQNPLVGKTHGEKRQVLIMVENFLWSYYHDFAPSSTRVAPRRVSDVAKKAYALLKANFMNYPDAAYAFNTSDTTRMLQSWARIRTDRVDVALPAFTVLARMAMILEPHLALDFADLEYQLASMDGSLSYAGSLAIWAPLAMRIGDEQRTLAYLKKLREGLAEANAQTRGHLLPMVDYQFWAIGELPFKEHPIELKYSPHIQADFNYPYFGWEKLDENHPMRKYVERYHAQTLQAGALN